MISTLIKKFIDNDGKEIQPEDFILYVTETKATVYKVLKFDLPYVHLLSLTSGNLVIRLDHELEPCYLITDKINFHYRGT
jgi:hypothetical protein